MMNTTNLEVENKTMNQNLNQEILNLIKESGSGT